MTEEEQFNNLDTKLNKPKQNTYSRQFTNRMKAHGTFDAYDIGTAFVLDSMRWAAVKKIIGCGTRNGGKPAIQDINEAIESLQQFLMEINYD